jgi:type III secretion system (T3SS) inner membrane Yop/YscD-like protein
LSGGSVRIGRGSQCEVRLDDPQVAEVQCILRPRGDVWYVQPVGPPGRISVEGQPVDVQSPLPLGLELRVGGHWLTLQSVDEEPAQIGSFDAPIEVEAVEELPAPQTQIQNRAPREELFRPRSEPARTGRGLEAEPERLEQWRSELEQRERWLEARQEEHRLEARWRSAGAPLRGRAAPLIVEPAPPFRPAEPPPRQHWLPRMADVVNRRADWRPPSAPKSPTVPPIEPVIARPVHEPVVVPPHEPLTRPCSTCRTFAACSYSRGSIGQDRS